MDRRRRQEPSRIYTEEQVRRVILSSGATIEGEVGTDFLVFCPFHPNFRTPAGEVDKEKGTFFCFSCRHICSLTEYVEKVSGKTFFQAERLIKSMEQDVDISALLNKTLEVKPEFVPFDEVMVRRLHAQAMESPRALRYFEGRQINTSSMDKFLLGYSDKQDMVTVPVHSPDGKILVGFVGRSVEGKEFKNTPGLPKSKVLFNLHRARKYDSVFVVESSFDAIRLDQNGLGAVATLGANVSTQQLELMKKYFNSVIVVADNDEAGKKMQERVLTRLQNRAIIVSLPTRFKDIGDMTDSDIQQLNNKTSDPLLSINI